MKMKMKSLFYPLFLLLFFSCNHNVSEKKKAGTQEIYPNATSLISRILSDSLMIPVYSSELIEGEKFLLIELPGKSVNFSDFSSSSSFYSIMNNINGSVLSDIADKMYHCDTELKQNSLLLRQFPNQFCDYSQAETAEELIYALVSSISGSIVALQYQDINEDGDSIKFQANVYLKSLERPILMGNLIQEKLLNNEDFENFKILIPSTREIKDIYGNLIDTISVKKQHKYQLSNCITANKWYCTSSQKYAIVIGLVFTDSLKMSYQSISYERASYDIQQNAMLLSGYIYEVIK